jgi:CRISPR-associated endonuclease/helicase Cas3
MHDAGKADPRFQSWLRGGTPVAADQAPLAKSGANGYDRKAIRRARERAGYPAGGRHELMSVAMLEKGEVDRDLDRDLLLHLVGSHHGWCRPFGPVAPDDEPVEVSYGGYRARSDHRLEAAGSGVAERFWRLTRRYGWWGLAYLEALVRLADHRTSEAEEDRKEAARAVASN